MVYKFESSLRAYEYDNMYHMGLEYANRITLILVIKQ
jgi:hypothetical protein